MEKSDPLSNCLTLDWNDQEQMLRWNGVEVPVIETCIQDLIHQKCIDQPTTIAVHAWDGQFTYQELDEM